MAIHRRRPARHSGRVATSPIVAHLGALGGVALRRELTPRFSGREIAAAVQAGLVVRDAPGRYALPTADAASRAVRRVNGVAIGRSAAAIWGMKLKTQPIRPEIAVPRGRRVRAADQKLCDVRWRDLDPRHVRKSRVTTPLYTVLDCAVALPFDEALAIADSALRAHVISREELLVAAAEIKRAGRQRALRVARHANGLAQNPFESVLRAISLDVPGLDLQPQSPIRSGTRTIHPDLSDRALRLVVEGDSYEFHTSKRQIDIDCERYDELVLDDWLVLRFSHPQAMHRHEWVRAVMLRAVGFRKTTRIPLPLSC